MAAHEFSHGLRLAIDASRQIRVTDPRRIDIGLTRDADWKLRVIDVRS